MLFVECGDKVDKAREQTGREPFAAFELRQGVVVAEKETESVYDCECLHTGIVTIFCYNPVKRTDRTDRKVRGRNYE
ncbi:hypothetical protein D3C81_2074470 [compost metagenome]